MIIMPLTCCCVPMCKNRGGYVFPKNKILKAKWINSIKLCKWKPTRTSVVCKSHFKETDYIDEDLNCKYLS